MEDREKFAGRQVSISLMRIPQHRLEEISISYNGGKDCLVLLILFLCALATHPAPLPTRLESVYIISPHPFKDVDDFVDESEADYSLALARYAMPMKEAFAKYLEDSPRVKAILVGTRRTDPHGMLLTHFDPTDQGWPAFMRVHPVIDWHYVEIWGVSCSLSRSLREGGVAQTNAVYSLFER